MKLLLIFAILALGKVCHAQRNEIVRMYPHYFDHPCVRECDGNNKVCRYDLTFSEFYTMQPDCLKCTTGIPNDCFNPQCIPGDGSSRIVQVYNGMLPGPTIVVCEGDTIKIRLINEANPHSTTLHFHGIHQRGSPNMDGVPMVTQWPIPPFTDFNYTFTASPAGTHWYHSHSASQRSDGAFGALIVKRPRFGDKHDPQTSRYDFDMIDHRVCLLEWMPTLSGLVGLRYLRTKEFYNNTLSTILVNSKGNMPINTVPPEVFYVQRGASYRFRFIHAGSVVCPIRVCIDNHQMEIIASDGFDTVPTIVDCFDITPGERYDVIIRANQKIGWYAIRIFGFNICAVNTLAVLAYHNAQARSIPIVARERLPRPNRIFNCINEAPGNSQCLSYTQLPSLNPIDQRLLQTPYQYYIAMDMIVYVPQRLRGVRSSELIVPFVNEIAYTSPKSPILYNPSCNPTCDIYNKRNCNGSFCECTHMLEFPENRNIELILVDHGSILDLTHPWHLHGYNFAVVGTGKLGTSTTTATVRDLDNRRRLTRNFNNPIVKDTVAVPDGGYVILRFFSDNPGYWLMRCHLDFHSDEGMALIVKTGTPPRYGNPSCTLQ